MSVHYDQTRGRWVVRWRETGKQRARRFESEVEAKALDARVSPARPTVAVVDAPANQGGVYAYETADGKRWRFVFWNSPDIAES